MVVLAAVAEVSVAAEHQGAGKMKKLTQQFLTAKEQQKVTEAVHHAEEMTSGEIVPMIVSASHGYPVSAGIGGIFLTLPLSLFLTHLTGSYLWLGPQNMWLFLIFSSLLYFPLFKLVDSSIRLKRLFLLNNQVMEEVEEAAITSFFQEGLYKTESENGILIFVSVLEKRVWILADRGIDTMIDQQQWQQIADKLSRGIKAGNQCAALCDAVSEVGEILSEHFPIGENDRNELHNLIIR